MTTISDLALRSRSIGELFDQSLRIYRGNFLKFIGIIAVVQVPFTIITLINALSSVQYVGDPSAALNDGFILTQILTFFISLLFIFLQVAATAALTRSIVDSYFGEKGGIIDAFKRVGKAWFTLIRVIILVVVVFILLLIWTLIPVVGWLTGPGILMYLSFMMMPLVAPIIVLEGRGARKSLRRAWDLGKKRFWWLFGFMLILAIFSQLVLTGPTTLINFVIQLVTGSPLSGDVSQSALIIQTVSSSLVSLVFSLLYVPLQAIAVTLAYFDLRVRFEGMDLAMQAQETAGREAREVAFRAPDEETGSLVTGRDIGYFVLLTLAVVGLYILLFAVVWLLGTLFFSATGFPLG